MSWLFTSVPLRHQWLLAIVLPFTRFVCSEYAHLPEFGMNVYFLPRELGAVILTHLGGQVNIIMHVLPHVIIIVIVIINPKNYIAVLLVYFCMSYV